MVCLFCLSTEFGVDESALFVRLRGVFNSTLITLSESKKVTISSLIFVQPSTLGICTILPRKGKGPNITKCNDTVLNVTIFFKKLCIREQIECVDAYELFTKHIFLGVLHV
jgi:hypothetical protein